MRMITETSLPRIYHFQECRNCYHYRFEFPMFGVVQNNFCVEKEKRLPPNSKACTRFIGKGSTKKKHGAIKSEGGDMLAEKMMSKPKIHNNHTGTSTSKQVITNIVTLPTKIGKNRRFLKKRAETQADN